MSDVLLSEPATVFIGPDTEKMSIHRDTCYFDRLDKALIYAVETMDQERRYGAYIRLERGHQILTWEEVLRRYEALADPE